MKKFSLFLGVLLLPIAVFAGILPVITVQPTNQIVAPNNNATFSVMASGATSYYPIVTSTNLTTWDPWITLSNATGIVTFSNAVSSPGWRYYRSLAPY